MAFKEFRAPFASALFAMVGCGFFTTFISIIFEIQHYSMLQIGLVQSAFFAGFLFGAWKIQKIISQVGHIQSLSAFGCMGIAVILLQGIFPNFYLWIFTRFLGGISISAIYVCIESWILEHTKQEERGMVLGLYMAALSTGCALGQKAIPFLNIYSLIPFLFAAMLIAVSIIPISLSTKKIRAASSKDFLRFDKLYKISPIGCFSCFVSGLIISASFSFLPIYSAYAGVPSFDCVFYFVIGGVILLWPFGKLSDHFDKKKVLFFLGSLLSVPSTLLFINKNEDPRLTGMTIFLYGGLCYALYPIGLTMVCEKIKSGSLAQAASSTLIFYGFGSVFGPIAASFLVHAIGGNGLFLFAILLSIGFSSLTIFLPRTKSLFKISKDCDF